MNNKSQGDAKKEHQFLRLLVNELKSLNVIWDYLC